MTSEENTKTPVSLFLPNNLTTEEPWKTYLEKDASFLKEPTQSEKGIQVYLDSETLEDLVFSLELRYYKPELTSKKLPISSMQEE